jgi:hypothetical protein
MSTTAEHTQERLVRYQCAMCHAPVTHTEMQTGVGYCDTHWRAVHPQRVRRVIRSIRPTPARAMR